MNDTISYTTTYPIFPHIPIRVSINGIEHIYEVYEYNSSSGFLNGRIRYNYTLMKVNPKSSEQLAAEDNVKKCEEALQSAKSVLKVLTSQKEKK